MSLNSSDYPVDDSRTGEEIARAALVKLGMAEGDARIAVAAIRGGNFPLTIVQMGHFTRLLTAAEKLTEENAELREAVAVLKAALELASDENDSDLEAG